jgi:hypothetical protein
VIAAGVDEDIPAIVRRADPEPVDTVSDYQLGQTHSQDGPKPPGHIVAPRSHVHVWSGSMDPHIWNRLRLLEDAIDPLCRLVRGGGLENLSDLLAKMAHRHEVGFDPTRGVAHLGSVEELLELNQVKRFFPVHHIEAVGEVLGQLEWKICVMRKIHLTPY